MSIFTDGTSSKNKYPYYTSTNDKKKMIQIKKKIEPLIIIGGNEQCELEMELINFDSTDVLSQQE